MSVTRGENKPRREGMTYLVKIIELPERLRENNALLIITIKKHLLNRNNLAKIITLKLSNWIGV